MLPGIALVLNQPPPLSVPDYERTLAIPGSWMSCIKVREGTVDRQPGLSVRLKLTLSYADFLMLAGAMLLAAISNFRQLIMLFSTVSLRACSV